METCDSFLGNALKSQVDGIPPEPDKLILDVGCGDGTVLQYLREKNRVIYGLDTDRRLKTDSLKSCFIKADAYHLPVKESAIDIILCFEVVEHLTRPIEFLKEAKRSLRGGGTIFISTPTPRSRMLPEFGFADHVSIWERKTWISILQGIGFEIDVMNCGFRVETKWFPIMSIVLTQTVGKALGYFKKYVKVTNTRLVCKKP